MIRDLVLFLLANNVVLTYIRVCSLSKRCYAENNISLSSSPLLEMKIPYNIAKILFHSCVSAIQNLTPSDNCYIRVTYHPSQSSIRAEATLKDQYKFILPETLENMMRIFNSYRKRTCTIIMDKWYKTTLKQSSKYDSTNLSIRNVMYI